MPCLVVGLLGCYLERVLSESTNLTGHMVRLVPSLLCDDVSRGFRISGGHAFGLGRVIHSVVLLGGCLPVRQVPSGTYPGIYAEHFPAAESSVCRLFALRTRASRGIPLLFGSTADRATSRGPPGAPESGATPASCVVGDPAAPVNDAPIRCRW